jgi:hypothetical protein
MSEENTTSLEDDMGFKMKEDYLPLEENQEENQDQSEETPEDKKEGQPEETPEDKVEDPKADNQEEEKKEDPAEEPKDNKGDEPTEEPKDEPAEEPQEDEPEKIDNSSLIREEISSVTEGEFDSVQEIYEELESMRQATSAKTIMERLDEAVEAVHGEGVTYSDVVEYKSRKYDEWDDIDLITEKLRMEDPDISQGVIDAELRQYDLLNSSQAEIDQMLEDGVIKSHTIDDLKARLTRAGYNAKRSLQEFQDSINIDELMVSDPREPSQEQPQGPTEEEVKAKQEALNKSIDDFGEIQLEVGTKDEPNALKFDVSDDDRNGIRDFLTGNKTQNWLDKRWTDKDGTINTDKLSTDVYKILNYDRDVKIGYTQGKSAGVKEEVVETNNIDLKKSGGSGPSDKNEGMSQAAQIAAEIN